MTEDEIRRLIDASTRPLRARVLALEAHLTQHERNFTNALATRIQSLLLHCDEAASGDISVEEQDTAIKDTISRWNGAAKKANGANGAHLS